MLRATRLFLPLVLCVTFTASPLRGQAADDSFSFVPTGGGKIYHEVVGTGVPVILLHGGWLNSRQWDEQIRLFGRSYRVIRYDQRGSGRSVLGDSAYSHADDLAALLRHLGIDRAHLVALSAGSQVAIDFALAHPEAVISLVIGASPLRGYDVGNEFIDGMRGVIGAGVAEDLQLLHERIWSFAPFRVASTMPSVRSLLDGLVVHENTWAVNRPNAPRAKVVDPPPAARLAEIKVPALVIVGEGEMPALVTEAEFAAKNLGNAMLVRVPNAGHFVNLEQPARYNEIVLGWLVGHTDHK